MEQSLVKISEDKDLKSSKAGKSWQKYRWQWDEEQLAGDNYWD